MELEERRCVNKMAIRYEITDAEPLDLFLGVCKRCKRPLRETDTKFPKSPWADKHFSTCPECQRQVEMERVYGIEVGMNCDDRCMGATGVHCECACGGVNHGGIWSEREEVFATALKAYRETASKREVNSDARKAATMDKKRAEFKQWCNAEGNRELVRYLAGYRDRMRDETEAYPNPFLTSLAEWLTEHKPLTENQVEAGKRTMNRRLNVAQRQPKSASNGLSTEGVTLGVFKYRGEVFVCKPNKQGTRSYANRVVKCTPRVTKAGTTVKRELEYAPGVLTKLTEDDRMPEVEVAEFMIEYGRCFCGRGLKREKSVRGMVGPVCAKKFGLKYGGE